MTTTIQVWPASHDIEVHIHTPVTDGISIKNSVIKSDEQTPRIYHIWDDMEIRIKEMKNESKN
jgi:hypothetical protein